MQNRNRYTVLFLTAIFTVILGSIAYNKYHDESSLLWFHEEKESDIKRLTKKAEQGDMDSMVRLGFKYLDYHNEPLDKRVISLNESILWFTKAAELGDVFSMRMLAGLHMQPEKTDIKKTIDWLEKAAMKNDIASIAMLGALYRDESFGEQDLKRADILIEKAISDAVIGAQNGDKLSMTVLGIMYLYSEKGTKEEALYWLEKSDSSNDPNVKELLRLLEDTEPVAE